MVVVVEVVAVHQEVMQPLVQQQVGQAVLVPLGHLQDQLMPAGAVAKAQVHKDLAVLEAGEQRLIQEVIIPGVVVAVVELADRV